MGEIEAVFNQHLSPFFLPWKLFSFSKMLSITFCFASLLFIKKVASVLKI